MGPAHTSTNYKYTHKHTLTQTSFVETILRKPIGNVAETGPSSARISATGTYFSEEPDFDCLQASFG